MPTDSPIQPPAPSWATSRAADLRAEIDAASRAPDAAVLHELAVAERALGDEVGAARDFLAAFNADPTFREPLEGLLELLDERGATRNVARVLEALARSAETDDERTRADLARAAYALDAGADEGVARAALEAIVRRDAREAAAWLELEVLAARSADLDTRVRALAARASLTRDAEWRGLLLLGLADLEARRGDTDHAFAALAAAAATDGVARFRAHVRQESLARRVGRDDVLAGALEAQAELATQALSDAPAADRRGVPLHARRSDVAVDAWYRAADARRRLGDTGAQAAALDRALALAPDDASLGWARMLASERNGDPHDAAARARSLLASHPSGTAAAALWLRVAAAADDPGARRVALESALAADPASIPARTLLTDLLADAGDAPALAARFAEGPFASLASAQRGHVLAAFVAGAEGRDRAAAERALAVAIGAGLPTATAARFARLLATRTGDAAWYEDATLELRASTIDDAERAGLAVEVARSRLARGDRAGAGEAVAAIGATTSGDWLGPLLAAFAGLSPIGDTSALDALAATMPDRDGARAVATAAAHERLRHGAIDDAASRLDALAAAEPGDALVAFALADLERRRAEPRRAAAALERVADATRDEGLAAHARLEAAVLRFRDGDAAGSVAAVEAARPSATVAATALSRTFSRAASRASATARRDWLAGVEAPRAAQLSATLETLGLALVAPFDPLPSLRVLLSRAQGDLAAASALARLAARDVDDAASLDLAFDVLAGAGGALRALGAAERARLAWRDGDDAARHDAARRWYLADPSAAAALAWHAATLADSPPADQAAARVAIAIAFASEDDGSLAAAAALLAHRVDPSAQVDVTADTGAVRLARLEIAPLRGPAEHADALLAAARDLGDADDELDARALAAFEWLAADRPDRAHALLPELCAARPADTALWEGLRAASAALGDARGEATACTRLAALAPSPRLRASFAERAAELAFDVLHDDDAGETALLAALDADAASPAFARLLHRVRARADHAGVLVLIERRLAVTDDADEAIGLHWERARALRQLGDRDGAIAALDQVRGLDPDHAGALALAGEIEVSRGNYAAAAATLARLTTVASAPSAQRLVSGLAAVDLYEHRLDDVPRALEVLVGLHQAGLATLAVRERLARAAARSSAWRHATAILEELMRERSTSAGRIEAARLAVAIWRDKVLEPGEAVRALDALLTEAPTDEDGLALLRSHEALASLRPKAFARARDALRSRLASDPCDVRALRALAEVAESLGDRPTAEAVHAVGALVAPAQWRRSASLRPPAPLAPPASPLDDDALRALAEPGEHGAVASVVAALAPALGEVVGPSLAELGLARRDALADGPLRDTLAVFAQAFGIEGLASYVATDSALDAIGLAGETTSLVLGAGTALPLEPRDAGAIARELYGLARGTGVVTRIGAARLSELVGAACRLAEVDSTLETSPETERALGRAVSRRTRKLLAAPCLELVAAPPDLVAWIASAQVSLARVAVVFGGDVAAAIGSTFGIAATEIASAARSDERVRSVLAFMTSTAFVELRARFGGERA